MNKLASFYQLRSLRVANLRYRLKDEVSVLLTIRNLILGTKYGVSIFSGPTFMLYTY